MTAEDVIADAIRLTRIYGKLIVADRPSDPKQERGTDGPQPKSA